MTRLEIGIFTNEGDNSKNNNLTWTICEFLHDFNHVHLICKFQNDPINTERVMLMAKSNIVFFKITKT